jgi:hypothetical protein
VLFDQVRQRVERRVTDYLRSRDARTVLGDEAMDEAAELWQAAQPADAGPPTAEENQRFGRRLRRSRVAALSALQRAARCPPRICRSWP